MKVTLNGIKCRGIDNLKSIGWWCDHNVMIWSAEHGAFWRPNAQGYTTVATEAWVLGFGEVYDRTKHCGPEKPIEFIDVGNKECPR